MATTIGKPFKSAGYSVERNEIISVSQPLVEDKLISDGSATSFAITKFADTQMTDLQAFRVFIQNPSGEESELRLDNVVGDNSPNLSNTLLFAKGGQYYFDPKMEMVLDAGATADIATAGYNIIGSVTGATARVETGSTTVKLKVTSLNNLEFSKGETVTSTITGSPVGVVDTTTGVFGRIFLKIAAKVGYWVKINYFTESVQHNHLEDGVLHQLATDLCLHPYGNDYSQKYSSISQKQNTISFSFPSSGTNGAGETLDAATGDGSGVGNKGMATLGNSVLFVAGDVGNRLREIKGNGMWDITGQTAGVADVTVLVPPTGTGYNNAVVDTPSYAEGEWGMIIPAVEVETQPYNLIYPWETNESTKPVPISSVNGQQNQTSVMNAIRRIGSSFVVESEKGTDILSSIEDINSVSDNLPLSFASSTATKGKRGPQKWRIKFSYDIITGFVNVNAGTNLQIGNDGQISSLQGQDGFTGSIIRTPGEMANIYYKFSRKNNKSKSGWFRRSTKSGTDIQGTYPLSYRLSCTDHGTGLFLYDHASVDQDDDYAWFVIQRHANNISGKIAMEEGKSPVHCVYCPSKVPLETGDYNFGYYSNFVQTAGAGNTTTINTTGLEDIYTQDGQLVSADVATEVVIVTDKDPVVSASYTRSATYKQNPGTYVPIVTGNDNNLQPITGSIANDAFGSVGYDVSLSTNNGYAAVLPAAYVDALVEAQGGATQSPHVIEGIKSVDQNALTALTGAGYPFNLGDGFLGGVNTFASYFSSATTAAYHNATLKSAILAGFGTAGAAPIIPTSIPASNTRFDASRPEQPFYPYDEFPGDNSVSNPNSNYWIGKMLPMLNKSKEERLGPVESGLAPYQVGVAPITGNVIGWSAINLIENIDYIIRAQGAYHLFEWISPMPSAQVQNLQITKLFSGDATQTAFVFDQEVWENTMPATFASGDLTPWGADGKGYPPVVLKNGSVVNVGVGANDYSINVSTKTVTFVTAPAVDDNITINVPINPMNTSITMDYVWDGAGFNGIYKNVYGSVSDVIPSHKGQTAKPMQSLNKLDVYLGGELDSALFPEEYTIDNLGTVVFTNTARQGVYVYSIPQDKIYLNGGGANGAQFRFSYENYDTSRSDGGTRSFLIKLPTDREMPLATSIEELSRQKPIYRFCVREADVYKPWDVHVSAITSQTDSPALFNPNEQISITPDKTFIFNFPGPLSTQRYVYPNSELDMMCFSGASSSALGGYSSITTKYDLDNGTVSGVGISSGTPSTSNGGISSNLDVLDFRDTYDWSTGTDAASTSHGRTYMGLASTQPYGNGMRMFLHVRGGSIRPQYSDFNVL